MSFDDILKLYQSGNVMSCLEALNTYSLDYKSKRNILFEGCDETMIKYLIENNSLICKAIGETSRNNLNWCNYLECFIKLYSKFRSITSIPLDLELNIVSNMLWWFSINNGNFENKSLYLRNICDIVSRSISKVLKAHQVASLSHDQDSFDLANQLNRAIDSFLCLSPVICLQLLAVITITVLILLRNDIDDCFSLIQKCLDQVDLLKLHLQQKVVRGKEEMYFKFGFSAINSTASMKFSTEAVDGFIVISSLVSVTNKQYKLAISYLKHISESKTNSFQFLANYIRAFCHYQLEEYSKAELCLVNITSTTGGRRYEGHYRLLLARLLTAKQKHQEALIECEALLASEPKLTSLTAYLASTVAQRLSLIKAQLLYFDTLVKSLKQGCSTIDLRFEGFEESCLQVIYKMYSISHPEALYLQARQLYLAGYHVRAHDSYSHLTEVLKDLPFDPKDAKLLPRRVQIVHETILSYIKANDHKGGEQLCRQAIRESSVISRIQCMKDESVWETALYGLEDDVVSMILLADILALSDKRKAIEKLNRCYNTLSEHLEQYKDSETLRQLCNWLLSRTLLRKAKLSSSNDAIHYFRRALIHMPGDKDVIFHCRQWALWNPEHDSFDTGDEVRKFPVDDIYSLALSHILNCSVTDEEWAALFDQENSQNVLDSLFDDDD